MTKHLLIVNPISGRGSGLKHKDLLNEFFNKNHLDFDLVVTERPGHAIEIAKKAVLDRYDIVVAVGGDGTCNEVLNGLMSEMKDGGHKPKMGVIPVGRGNDFAYSMGIPVDFDLACKQYVEPKFRSIDIGQVVGGFFPEGRYFGNGVGIGFDAVVGFEALKLKFLTGFPSYIVAALKTIFLYFKAPKLRVELDGETIIDKFLMVSIMNGIRMGGGFYMAPNGDPTDKKFTLCIVNELGKFATFPLIMKFMKGTQEGDPKVRMVNSSSVKVTAVEGKIPAHADGETVCYDGSSIDIHLIPGAIELAV